MMLKHNYLRMKENAEVEITLLNSNGEWLTTHVITEDQV